MTLSNRLFQGGMRTFCLLLPLLPAAGSLLAAETANARLAAGGAVVVYDKSEDGLLAGKNAQFGVNLAIDGGIVPGLLTDLGLSDQLGITTVAIRGVINLLGIRFCL